MALYQLQCKHCKSFTEITSEYTTFCSNCGKKLEVSYADWKQQHPNQTFTNFLNTVCIDREAEEAVIADLKMKNKKRNLRLLVILTTLGLIIGVFFTFYYFKGDELIDKVVSLADTPDDFVSGEWVQKTYPELHLYLETPVELDSFNLVLPEEVMLYIDSKVSLQGSYSSAYFHVMVSHIIYRPEIDLSLEGALNGALGSMKSGPGIESFNFSESPVSIKNAEAKLVKGEFTKLKVHSAYQMLLLKRSNQLTQIVVIYHQNDEEAQKATGRIIKTLRILD